MDCKDMALFAAKVLDNKKARDIVAIHIGSKAAFADYMVLAWILMDYGDIIVNLLTVEMREKYNIEKVWGDCEFLNLED